jgi:hypothetical protein
MKAEIIEVVDYSERPAKAYQWVTCNGKTEIFSDRKEAIARGLELSNGAECTLRDQNRNR